MKNGVKSFFTQRAWSPDLALFYYFFETIDKSYFRPMICIVSEIHQFVHGKGGEKCLVWVFGLQECHCCGLRARSVSQSFTRVCAKTKSKQVFFHIKPGVFVMLKTMFKAVFSETKRKRLLARAVASARALIEYVRNLVKSKKFIRPHGAASCKCVVSSWKWFIKDCEDLGLDEFQIADRIVGGLQFFGLKKRTAPVKNWLCDIAKMHQYCKRYSVAC